MQTNHVEFTARTEAYERPSVLPFLTADDFCKAKYSQNDKRCYTARMLDIFLDDDQPYVKAYKEFRLKTMDVMYEKHKEDHATNAEQRAALFNDVAQRLGYPQIPSQEYYANYQV